MKVPLTRKQHLFYEFLKDFYCKEKRKPTEKECKEHHFPSPGFLMTALVQKGWIIYDFRNARNGIHRIQFIKQSPTPPQGEETTHG